MGGDHEVVCYVRRIRAFWGGRDAPSINNKENDILERAPGFLMSK